MYELLEIECYSFTKKAKRMAPAMAQRATSKGSCCSKPAVVEAALNRPEWVLNGATCKSIPASSSPVVDCQSLCGTAIDINLLLFSIKH